MRQPRVQFKIWRLMAAVTLVAVLLAWFPVVVVVAIIGMALILLVPIAYHPPERRLMAAAWGVLLYPLMVPVYFHATWITAWCVLGHRPRTYLDDPRYLGPIVAVPYVMTFLSLQLWPISMCAGLIPAIDGYRRRSVIRILIPPFAWLSVYALLKWDPLGVLYWYFD